MKFLLTLPFFFLLLLLAAAQYQRKVAFTAYFSDGGNIAIDNGSPIPFNKVTVNEGHGYDTRTGVFTAPVSGLYLFILSAKASSRASSPNYIRLSINKSGFPVMLSDLMGSSLAYMDQTSSFATLQVSAGETVDVRYYYTSSDTPPIVIDKWYETSFTGILLWTN